MSQEELYTYVQELWRAFQFLLFIQQDAYFATLSEEQYLWSVFFIHFMEDFHLEQRRIEIIDMKNKYLAEVKQKNSIHSSVTLKS